MKNILLCSIVAVFAFQAQGQSRQYEYVDAPDGSFIRLLGDVKDYLVSADGAFVSADSGPDVLAGKGQLFGADPFAYVVDSRPGGDRISLELEEGSFSVAQITSPCGTIDVRGSGDVGVVTWGNEGEDCAHEVRLSPDARVVFPFQITNSGLFTFPGEVNVYGFGQDGDVMHVAGWGFNSALEISQALVDIPSLAAPPVPGCELIFGGATVTFHDTPCSELGADNFNHEPLFVQYEQAELAAGFAWLVPVEASTGRYGVPLKGPGSCAPVLEWQCISECDFQMMMCMAGGGSMFLCSLAQDECYEWCGILSGCDI